MFVPSFYLPPPSSLSHPFLTPCFLFIQFLIRSFLLYSFYHPYHAIHIPPLYIHPLSPSLFFISTSRALFLHYIIYLLPFPPLTISYTLFSLHYPPHPIFNPAPPTSSLFLSLFPASRPTLPAPHYQTFFPVNVPGVVREEGEQNLHHPLSPLSRPRKYEPRIVNG